MRMHVRSFSRTVAMVTTAQRILWFATGGPRVRVRSMKVMAARVGRLPRRRRFLLEKQKMLGMSAVKWI